MHVETLPGMTNADYHADPAIGSSMLETFRYSRRLYHAKYVAKTEPEGEPSDAMKLGTMLHLRVLQPELFADNIAEPLPELARDGKKWLRRKGSDHERWWQEELAAREGKIMATAEELAAVESMAQSVQRCDRARNILAMEGQPELPIFWDDPKTGLRLKCMIDWHAHASLDIKTSATPDPAGFAKQSAALGNHRKRAHYMAGLQALTGEPDPLFLHLVVGNKSPWSTCVYELDDLDLMGHSLGVRQRRATLNALAECLESGDWSEPWERDVVRISLPRYAFYQDEYTFF